ncbi:hypothetical protein B566_EDAN015918 [Ephemera danica]|nr:hypothetical protein B566_EDAN015918 [Ephemera danica]
MEELEELQVARMIPEVQFQKLVQPSLKQSGVIGRPQSQLAVHGPARLAASFLCTVQRVLGHQQRGVQLPTHDVSFPEVLGRQLIGFDDLLVCLGHGQTSVTFAARDRVLQHLRHTHLRQVTNDCTEDIPLHFTTKPLDDRLAIDALNDLGCAILTETPATPIKNNKNLLIPDFRPSVNVRTTLKFTPTKMKQRRLINRLNNTNSNLRKRNERLNKKMDRLQNKQLTREEITEACQPLLPDAPQVLFNMQLRFNTEPKPREYLPEEKDLALTIYYNSSRCYRFMRQELKFHLPFTTTIRRWTNITDFKPGVCSAIFSKLEDKIKTMTANEKKCVLMFDEIGIKRWLIYNRLQDLIE